MVIELYRNTSPNNALHKVLNLVTIQDCALKDMSSFITLSIDLKYNQIIDFNYVYIPEFQRYYFINDIETLRNNVYRINLQIDVLTSYKDTILNSNLHITKGTSDLPIDKNITSTLNKKVSKHDFDIAFNKDGTILVIC